ncbi:aromatic acid exporter family protein [Micromonospora sp. CV4]|uniref:FUSC family protein n=1 Tax=Micromonospora sp. CV4 TaxID=2478711 RepID=UPI000EF44C5B|nr:FUSC family protein [Micromonospora sp. CV4]RLP99586.1 aromatic acid exporter family protein [Micromonospora sp. CV4]
MPANQEATAAVDPAPQRRSLVGRRLAGLRRRGQRLVRARAWRLRLFGLLAVQAGIAAAIAWFVAYQFLDNSSPVFAPTTAVGIVAAAMGSRLRRTAELLAGVVLGLAVGDTLMPLFGIGPWQTGLVVVLAIIVAILLKGGGSLLTQAGGTAVLIATLEPPVRDLSVPRFVDAAVGGLIGLAVGLLLVPIHPQRTVQRLAEPVLDPGMAAMHDLAAALRARDLGEAQRSLRRLRDLDPRLTALEEGLSAAQEVVRLAPLRWRDRTSLAFYTEAVRHLERTLHSCRSIARRLTTALKDDEPIPAELPAAIDLLANGVQTLRSSIRAREGPHKAREQILMAVELVGRAQGEAGLDPTRPHTHRLGYSGLIVVGEFRTAAHDLLIASGLDAERAADLVRRAVDQDEQD